MKKLFFNKKYNHKKSEIWKGILQKAKSDGDYSLIDIQELRRPIFYTYKKLMTTAAAIVLFLGFSFYAYRLLVDNSANFLSDKELSLIYADTSSASRMVLSNGDTIFLDHVILNESFIDSRNGKINLAVDHDSIGILDDGVNVVESGRGKQINVVLPDGTKVWLNAFSKIEFPSRFGQASRDVKVDGEVYFEVSKDIHKPFIAKFGAEEVTVLGTHFNIRKYTNENKDVVTLLEGAISVSNKGDKLNPKLLKPAEQLSLFSDGDESYVKTLHNPLGVIAWKNGEFYFNNANVDEIVKELERWYPVNISIQNEKKSKKISGRIKRTDSMKSVVDMLRFFDIELLIVKQL
ncbi:FecR family protein [Sphingobacterium bovistauri]|uniref:FecR domain-containing protein n=1 Tax=Sphingobacterium bovistauri TaxID=2781959 RepID=A0ABS7Z4B6_9SPHI|nr:FecR domain-containing protein [Sphingobacterium bovistauri]MCA5005026.1 FecR domain-containing protein [Sphingobacterium bovistauri]